MGKGGRRLVVLKKRERERRRRKRRGGATGRSRKGEEGRNVELLIEPWK